MYDSGRARFYSPHLGKNYGLNGRSDPKEGWLGLEGFFMVVRRKERRGWW